jgi:predicted phage terminase large subunit-like protein
MITAGVGDALSGRGGHLLIIDDPLKSWKDASNENVRQRQIEWFNSTFYTRAEPDASIVVIMTRWHEGDLAGYLESEHGDQWEVLKIPAIAEEDDPLSRPSGAALCEERYGLSELNQIRSSIGSRAWDSLYQQNPRSEKGNVLRRGWWKRYRELPEVFDEVVQSWDLTFHDGDDSDFVVGQVWGRLGANKFLIDQVRGRMDFSRTVDIVKEFASRYPQTGKTLIEGKANGSALYSVLKGKLSGLIKVEPDGGKRARVESISGEIEAGNIYLPERSRAPWIDEFECECADFPNGKHDDQVDAMVYALKAFRK